MTAQQYSDSQQQYRHEFPCTGSSCPCASCDWGPSLSANNCVEDCYGFEQSRPIDYSDLSYQSSNPQINVSDYSWSPEDDQTTLAGAQFEGQYYDSPALPHQHTYKDVPATGSWRLAQQYPDLSIYDLGYTFDDIAMHVTGDTNVLDDPLCATAHASRLSNISPDPAPVSASSDLLPPLSWHDFGIFSTDLPLPATVLEELCVLLPAIHIRTRPAGFGAAAESFGDRMSSIAIRRPDTALELRIITASTRHATINTRAMTRFETTVAKSMNTRAERSR
ncbi:hypothetical protein LTR56_002659 [Elasticomyces elasticus]|nr:hypothetical protein LTR22_014926 [Elasticomyces elasticus]KAK3657143.1 hypothetical protein LTR56_002659 [Elasticomyces elasticus]KAK4914385.1 hypothetical protein LTR49_017416 [Elasticomyces elasticus]KAK5753834.1 hypothetical protein LTS12_016037 [Elasticomyces elasticus]